MISNFVAAHAEQLVYLLEQRLSINSQSLHVYVLTAVCNWETHVGYWFVIRDCAIILTLCYETF